MKKLSFIFLVSLCSISFYSANAQFGKGDKLLNLGVGLNSAYNGGLPLNAAFEVGVSDVLSIGAGIDFLSYNYRYSNVNYGFTAIYPGVRVSYHFNKLFKLDIDELDIYGGGSLGFRSFVWHDSNNFTGLNNSYSNGVYAGAYVGGRWYFKPGFGVFLELGGGVGGASNAKTGVTFKF